MLYPGLVITQLQSASRNVINQSSSIMTIILRFCIVLCGNVKLSQEYFLRISFDISENIFTFAADFPKILPCKTQVDTNKQDALPTSSWVITSKAG